MSSALTKCSCGHCDGHLEFDTAYAGERVACPHCGKETLLYIPSTANPPPTPYPAPGPLDTAHQSGYRLSDSTEPRTLAAQIPFTLPRKTPARNANPFARQAARVSWVGFIFALVLGALFRGFEGSPMGIIILKAVPLLLLLGLGLGFIALFSIRKHGIKGILIPAVLGLILNGLFLGAILRVRYAGERQPREMKSAIFKEYARQSKNGVPAKRMPLTGEPNIDAGLQIKVDLSHELDALIGKMKAELAQLKEKGVCLVLTNKAAIKSELDKRTAGQTIIRTYKEEAAALVESARQRCITSSMPESMKQVALRDLAQGGQVWTYVDEGFSLGVRLQEAEGDFLQFMLAEFGRYRLVGGKVSFAAFNRLEEYNRLTQRIRDVGNEAEAFDRRRSEMLESMADRIKEITK